MKKLILLTLIVLGTVSFARGGSSSNFDNSGLEDSLRDHEYLEKIHIVEPMEENIERMSRLSAYELEIDSIAAEENIAKYPEFHRDLDRADIGEERESFEF